MTIEMCIPKIPREVVKQEYSGAFVIELSEGVSLGQVPVHGLLSIAGDCIKVEHGSIWIFEHGAMFAVGESPSAAFAFGKYQMLSIKTGEGTLIWERQIFQAPGRNGRLLFRTK